MMRDIENLTGPEKIKFAQSLLKMLKTADKRGVSPMQIVDEENGCILPDSDGMPCFLKKWTLFDDGGSKDVREHNDEGQARVGDWGITVYSTDDSCTLVRFADGVEMWCNTPDLFIDESSKWETK